MLCLHWFNELCLSALAASFKPSSTKYNLPWLLISTLTILLNPHFSRRSDNSTSHLNMDPRNAQFISIFNGWEMFQPNLKSKLLQPFSIVETRVVFTTRPLLPATKKDVLSPHHHNNVIYQFLCHCDSRYIGRTSLSQTLFGNPKGPVELGNPNTCAETKLCLNFILFRLEK